MISGKKVMAVIPARGGSKGVPRKNIRALAGKPLIAWTIEQAKQSRYLDRVVLSSEDEEILEVARRLGCDVPLVRPAELARDESLGIDVLLHAMSVLPEFDLVVQLQPTSPLRLASDIDECIEKCVGGGELASCVSLTEVAKPPYWMFNLDAVGKMKPFLEFKSVPRQELAKLHVLNGAVYVASAAQLREQRSFITPQTLGYVMPLERSVDIDAEYDFWVAEALLERRNATKKKA